MRIGMAATRGIAKCQRDFTNWANCPNPVCRIGTFGQFKVAKLVNPSDIWQYLCRMTVTPAVCPTIGWWMMVHPVFLRDGVNFMVRPTRLSPCLC